MPTRCFNVRDAIKEGILITDFKFCEHCGRNVSLSGQLCARCGADLSGQQVVRSSQGPTATQKTSAAAQVTNEIAPTQKRLTAGEWNDKGAALAKSGRNQEAIQYFDKALELDPKNVEALVNKGTALYALGRYEAALQCCYRTLSRDPKNAAAQELKRVALEKTGKTGRSTTQPDVNYWKDKGKQALDAGDARSAITCFNKALEINPQDMEATGYKMLATQKIGSDADVAQVLIDSINAEMGIKK
jgi:tetratricopeptide (TPR) repeat protein